MSHTAKKVASITIDHNAVTGEYIYRFTRQDRGIQLSGGKTLSGHHVITAKETSLGALLARPFYGVSQITLVLPFWVKIHDSFHYNPDGIIVHARGRLTLSREVLGVQDAFGKSRVVYEVYRAPDKTGQPTLNVG